MENQIMIVGILHLSVVKCFVSKKMQYLQLQEERIGLGRCWSYRGKILYHLHRMISGHLAVWSQGEQEEEIGLSWTNGSYDIRSTSFAVLQQWEMCKTCLSQLLSNLCLPLSNSGC